MSERIVPSNGHGPTLLPSAVELGPAGLAEKASEANGRKRRRAGPPAGVAAAPTDLQLRDLLLVLQAAERGDFEVRLARGGPGTQWDKIATTMNDLLARKAALANEMVRVERVVGREGRMDERVSLGPGAKGGWAASVGAVNALITQLVRPTTEVARVISAFAAGDLTQKMALEIEGQSVRGEYLRLGVTAVAHLRRHGVDGIHHHRHRQLAQIAVVEHAAPRSHLKRPLLLPRSLFHVMMMANDLQPREPRGDHAYPQAKK